MPYHVLLDTAGETKLGKLSIGTTRRGIGPCYADKASRLGIRVQDMLDEKILRKKIMAALEPKQQALRELSVQRRKLRKEGEQTPEEAQDPRLDLHAMTEEYISYGHQLEPHIADTARLCWAALDAGQTVLFEGAQATLLDLDHGTYPFVTSSNPIAGAACVGAGVGPADIDEVWGVVKAYQTRVGAGPFPTELTDETGRLMVERGHEYGTTTGRERRCGWLDLVALRYAVRLNRMNALTVTKLDVLAGIDPLRVAVRYRSSEGAVFEEFPYHQSILHSAEAEYEDLPGFEGEIGEARSEEDLPANARAYLRYVSDFVGVPIRLVSVGPEREQVVWIGDRVPDSPARRALSGRPAGGGAPSGCGGRDRPGGLLAPLAAAQHPHREDRRDDDRRQAEAELHAEQPLAGPVDVAQVEQQRGLVEGEAHSDPHRHSEAVLERVVLGQQRRGPGGEGEGDAGDEVVDVAAADPHVAERPPAAADPPGGEAHTRRTRRGSHRGC